MDEGYWKMSDETMNIAISLSPQDDEILYLRGIASNISDVHSKYSYFNVEYIEGGTDARQ